MRIVYKIIHVLIDVAFDDLFTFSPNRSTRRHVYKLCCSKSNLLFQITFSHNAVSQHGTLYQMMLLHLRLSIFNSRLYIINFEKFLII